MIISELRTHFFEELKELYPSEEVSSFFYLLTEHILKLKRLDVTLNLKQIISKETELHFQNAIDRLKKEEPIQYIIGETEFFGLTFKVTPATLIPRPETEELVRWIASEFDKTEKKLTILDIGTGSGCIPISLATIFSEAKISAIDISEEALKVAQQNAKDNKVEVGFFQKNILESTELDGKYDLIVSNPPYVRIQEKSDMQPNVLKHEPELALFVSDENPLIFYQKIAQLAKSYLTDKGQLYFEINEYLSKELVQLLQNEGFKSVEIKQDMFGKDRMLRCILNEKS